MHSSSVVVGPLSTSASAPPGRSGTRGQSAIGGPSHYRPSSVRIMSGISSQGNIPEETRLPDVPSLDYADADELSSFSQPRSRYTIEPYGNPGPALLSAAAVRAAPVPAPPESQRKSHSTAHHLRYNPRKVDALPPPKRKSSPMEQSPSGDQPLQDPSSSPIMRQKSSSQQAPSGSGEARRSSFRSSLILKSPIFKRFSRSSVTEPEQVTGQGRKSITERGPKSPTANLAPPFPTVVDPADDTQNAGPRGLRRLCQNPVVKGLLLLLLALAIALLLGAVCFFWFFIRPLMATVVACSENQPLIVYAGKEAAAFRGQLNVLTQMKEFLNIPYAPPLSGEARFKRMTPYNYQTEPNMFYGNSSLPPAQQLCPQVSLTGSSVEGHADCHYLNVHVPVLGKTTSGSASSSLPVVVLLQSLLDYRTFQSQQFHAQLASAAHSVEAIYVTFQQRVGPLHTFVHPGSKKSNFGLDDSVAVLEWVKSYIAAFGGNAGKVTLVASGSGATQALALLGTKGLLFHKVWLSAPALRVSHNRSQVLEKQKRLNFLIKDTCDTNLCPDLDEGRLPTERLLLHSSQYFPSMKSSLDVLFDLDCRPDLESSESCSTSEGPIRMVQDEYYVTKSSLLDNIDSFSSHSIAVVNTIHEANAFLEPSAIRFFSRDILEAYARNRLTDLQFETWKHLYLPDETSDVDPEEVWSATVSDARVTCPLNKLARDLEERQKSTVYRVLLQDEHGPVDHIGQQFYTKRATHFWDAVLHTGAFRAAGPAGTVDDKMRTLLLKALREFVHGDHKQLRPYRQNSPSVNLLHSGRWLYEDLTQFKKDQCKFWSRVAKNGDIYELSWTA